MPANFPTIEQRRHYGRYTTQPTAEELGRFFHLADDDLGLLKRRQSQARLGLAIQLGTVRFLGGFLPRSEWPTVPIGVIEYMAAQLTISAAPDIWRHYLHRDATLYQHQRLITATYGYHQFGSHEAGPNFDAWITARIRLHDEPPSVLFDQAVNWLRSQKILLPGITTLERSLIRVRQQVRYELWQQIDQQLSATQRQHLQTMLEGEKYAQTDLDRLRTGPDVISAIALKNALERIRALRQYDLSNLDISAVSPDRVKKLARHAAVSKADTIDRLSEPRKWATLAAFAYAYEARAIDDALDLFDALIQTRLTKSARKGQQKRLRTLRDLDTAARQMNEYSGIWLTLPADEPIILNDVFYPYAPRENIQTARSQIAHLTRKPNDRYYDELLNYYSQFRRFLPTFWHLLIFDGVESEQVLLEAIAFLKELEVRLEPALTRKERQCIIDEAPQDVIEKNWEPWVIDEDGHIELRYYTFNVLLQLRDALRRRTIFVVGSERWGDIRSKLISAEQWQHLKPQVIESLGHSAEPAPVIEAFKQQLAAAYRQVGDNLPHNTKLRLGKSEDKTRFILEPLLEDDEPASLVSLRKAVQDLLPRVDIQELFQEVVTWTNCLESMTPISGNRSRAQNLPLSLAAVLLAEAMNIGFTPFVNSKVPALTRGRLSWVLHNYVRNDTIAKANARLVLEQDKISLAQFWGGGEVAVADGLRFVVPVRSAHSGASRRYFGTQRGITWYHWMLDQYMDFHGTVVTGALRDAPWVLDGLLEQETHQQPKELITDTGGYSDIIFGLFWLLGYRFSPRLADIGDARFWRLDREADHGVLNDVAKHKAEERLIADNWDDMLRAAGSIRTRTVKSSELVRSLHRSGRTSTLGRAIGTLGRVAKTLFMLDWVDDEIYRRRVLVQLNRVEFRNKLARKLCFGNRGRISKKYRDGQEEQLNALGFVLNMIVLWNTRYMNAALNHLRSTDFDVRDEDIERLSPLGHKHINFVGRYAFSLPEEVLRGELRPFHDPADPANLM